MRTQMSRILAAVIGAALLPSIAGAQDGGGSEHRNWVFGGLEAGLVEVTGSDASQGSQKGHREALSLGYARYFDDWVLDAAGAYHLVDTTERAISYPRETSLRTAGLSVSARTRWGGGRFQLGPVLSTLFGADSSFSLVSGPSKSLIELGLLFAFEPAAALDVPNKYRIFAKVMTDVNISERQITSGVIGIQFGLPFGPTSGATKTETAPLPVEEPPVAPPLPPEPVADLDVVLGEEILHFDTGTTHLPAKSEKFTHALGDFLARNSGLFKSLVIEGHSDVRGDANHNLLLSQKRAAAVRNALIKGGVQPDKLTSQGFGSSRPLLDDMSEYAWAKNRRVEIKFFGVSDKQRISEYLRELNSRIQVR